MRTGIVLGCFIPLHAGHMSLIARALAENDMTVIAVCGRDSDRGRDYIPFRDRIRLMTEKYACGRVKVVAVDDDKIGMDGSFSVSNWERWCTECFDQAGLNPYDKSNTYTWYTGEPSYAEKIKQIYNDHKMRLVDRQLIPISGTGIRDNTDGYRDRIAPEFIDYLKKKGKIS